MIGANATIGPGLTLGEFCMVGMGSVVTRSVLPHTLVVGNPARPVGLVCTCGRPILREAEVGAEEACSQCGRETCRDDARPCATCSAVGCPDCVLACSTCGAAACLEHVGQCATCKAVLCDKHRNRCPRCERVLCAGHYGGDPAMCAECKAADEPVTAELVEPPAGVVLQCPTCGTRLRLPAEHARKRGRCPKCGSVVAAA